MGISISPAALAEAMRSKEPPFLLDVRGPEEHAYAALPGSRLAPLHELPNHVDDLAAWKEQEVVVYCHHGIRSLHAIGYLESVGFKKLRNLSGGIDAWSLLIDPKVPRY